MYWSVSVIGKPEAVCAELDRFGESLSGQDKADFDGVKPHLQGLVRENYARSPPYAEPVVHLEASGMAITDAGERVSGNCQVTLKTNYTKLV